MPLSKFTEYTVDSFPKFKAGELQVENCIVIGKYPVCENSIQKDFDNILKNKEIKPTKVAENKRVFSATWFLIFVSADTKIIKQSNIGVVQMETDSIISNSRYGIVGNAIEKIEYLKERSNLNINTYCCKLF